MEQLTMMPQALPASQLKDLELVKWLEHKLGDSNDLWCGRMAAAFLSQHMLEELDNCFQALEAHVKLKLILAIPHINYRLMNAWRVPLQNLLDLARRDADDWVETVSEMYRDVPTTGVIIPDRVNETSYFYRTLEELKATLRASQDKGNLKLIPPSYDFVSQTTIKERFGIAEVEVVKHFNLRKRAKSSILKAEVLRGIESGGSGPKKDKLTPSTSYPIKMRSTERKPNNQLPMRGIPTVNTCKLSAGFTNEPKKFQRTLSKREGGAKLIDIAELPQAQKIRRKEQDDADRKRKAEERENARLMAIKLKEEKKAAAIRAQQEAKEAAEAKRLAAIEAAAAEADAAAAALTNCDDEPSPPEETSTVRAITVNPKRPKKGKKEEQPESPRPLVGIPPPTREEKPPTIVRQLSHQATSSQEVPKIRQAEPGPSAAPNYLNLQLNPTINVETQPHLPTLTQQQHAELMDILNTSPCLDATTERWIVNFMGGSRVNPRPELGNVVNIKLNETIENGIFADGTLARLKVETVFEMNFETGNWRRIKRARLCTAEELQQTTQAAPSNLQFNQQFVQEQLQTQLQQQQRPSEAQMRQSAQHSAQHLHHHPQTPQLQSQRATMPHILSHAQARPMQQQQQQQHQAIHVQQLQSQQSLQQPRQQVLVHGQRPLHHQGPPPLHHPSQTSHSHHLDHRY